MNPCLTTNQVIYIVDEKAPLPLILIAVSCVEVGYECKRSSQGWNVQRAVSGTKSTLVKRSLGWNVTMAVSGGEVGRLSFSG